MFVTTVGNFLRLFEWNDVEILQKMNYEVHYAADFTQLDKETNKMYQKKNIVLHPLPIRRSPLQFKGNITAFLQLRRLIREERFDLLHCHTPMGGMLGRLAAAVQRKKPFVLYTAHGFHFYRGAPFYCWLLYFPAEYLLAKKTDCLIVVNEEDYRRALHFPLRNGGRTERIPGVGLSTEKLKCRQEQRAELRAKHGIPEECFYILTAGELNRNKNQQVLIRAAAMLRQKQICLGICGKGALRESLERLAEELGVAGQVRFLGYRNDLQELLTAADAFAFPSVREGFALAPLEALAAGLPLVTSERRDSREYIRHRENGLVCKRNAPEEYAEAFLLLMENPGLCRRLSEEGRRTAGQFALDKTARIMERVYKCEGAESWKEKRFPAFYRSRIAGRACGMRGCRHVKRRDKPHEGKEAAGNQCYYGRL
ncbi:MAG: glycosyltransferase [Lachnospiraceae bacterium]|nr:glycosyltransferase [Lachnospiraceae bacterium]